MHRIQRCLAAALRTAPDFFIGQRGLDQFDRHAAVLHRGYAKPRDRLVRAEQHGHSLKRLVQLVDLECKVRHALQQRMQRAPLLKAMELHAREFAAAVARVHPHRGTVAFAPADGAGRDAQVMKLVVDAVAHEHFFHLDAFRLVRTCDAIQ
ncbi:hypothetical protein GCM10027093_44220 [Paraburkholderia jirisanensis]